MKHLPATAMRSNGADYVRTYHHVAVDATVSMDDILRPSFWVHFSNSLRVGDLIDIMSDAFDIQLRVTGKGVGFVNVRPRFVWQAGQIAAPVSDDSSAAGAPPPGYSVKRGPGGRWRVFVNDPHLEVAGNIATEPEAINAARAHFQKSNALAE